jgi:Serine/threonine protein phosphatase
LGTRDADFLQPTIQRFILEENGLLLLCSDGVSDNGLIERTWAEPARAVLTGRMSLDLAVRTWLDLANQQNGYDNATIALLHCHVTSPVPDLLLPKMSGGRSWGSTPIDPRGQTTAETETESPAPSPTPATSRSIQRKGTLILGAILILLLGGGIGMIAWSRLDPNGFQQFRERIVPFKTFENLGL